MVLITALFIGNYIASHFFLKTIYIPSYEKKNVFIQLIKETGGLKRLVALITDQVPPEEEPKAGTGKGEKKAGSRAAKKSAKGSKSGECCLHVLRTNNT